MKKLLTLLLVTLFVFAGCGQQEPDPVIEELTETHVGPTAPPFSSGPSEVPGN
jgi:hypothetical protein